MFYRLTKIKLNQKNEDYTDINTLYKNTGPIRTEMPKFKMKIDETNEDDKFY